MVCGDELTAAVELRATKAHAGRTYAETETKLKRVRGGTWTGAGAGGAASARSAAAGESEESRRRSAVELELEVKAEMSTRRRAGAADMKKRTQTVAMAAPSTKDTSGLTLLMSPPFIGYNLVEWVGVGRARRKEPNGRAQQSARYGWGCGGTRQSEFPFNTSGSGGRGGQAKSQVVVKRN
jgi:hypothetical protein